MGQKPLKKKNLANNKKMANVVYNYPKSSCHCFNCTEKTQKCPTSGVPTNMSVRDCEFPSYYECHDRKPFRFDIEPRNEKGYVNINPSIMKSKYATDFTRVKCSGKQGCPKVQYASTDPRLISVPHSGQVLTLDRPPVDSTPVLADVATDKSLNGYGQHYQSYADVNGGDIMYYINKEQQDPFFSPNFTTSARAYGTMYKDPMGAMKPQYDREPLKCNNPLDTQNENYDGGLSFIQDTMNHRQDLMALQSRKRNQERWEPRWEGLGGASCSQ